MLEEFKTADVLPVGILDKVGNYRFIGFVKGMLQVVQTDKQTDRHTWAAHLYRVQGAKLSFKERPVDLICQTIQFMLAIEHLIKAGTEQVALVRNLWFGLHEITGN